MKIGIFDLFNAEVVYSSDLDSLKLKSHKFWLSKTSAETLN